MNRNIDPLTLAVVEARINALNLELGARMFRQAFSVPTAHIRDLGTVLFDKDERTLAIGNFMPVHTGGSEISLKGMLDWIGRENIYEDDFIIGNDTFIVRFGHLADWSFLRPIYYEGELVFYHFARTHQYDQGGAFPGCYFPRSYDCHGEGLMLPPVKIVERGKIKESTYSVILRNLRGATLVRADNMLVYGSMKQIEQRITGLLKEYGKETVMAALDELIDRARAAVKAIIAKWPAGTYYAERAADWDGTTDRPVWVRLAMTVKPEEGKVVFDFSESDPQCDFINVPLGQVWSSVTAGFLWCLPPGLSRNKGFFDCMEVITKEGTCLSPVYPAYRGAAGSHPRPGDHRVRPACHGPGRPEGDPGHMGPPRESPLCGEAARQDRSEDRIDHGIYGALLPCGGLERRGLGLRCRRRQRIEPAGRRHGPGPHRGRGVDDPLHLVQYEFLTDSCGHGQWRGGLGTHVEAKNMYDRKVWQPLDCLTMSGNADGEKFESVGLQGGTGGTKTQAGDRARRGAQALPHHGPDLP